MTDQDLSRERVGLRQQPRAVDVQNDRIGLREIDRP